MERERLTSILNNNGFYGFTKDYIYYEVDSALNSKQADVSLIIKNMSIPSDDPTQSPIIRNHKIYFSAWINGASFQLHQKAK